ncbi:mitochondrial carrier protein [Skeletonema marinoi]|uniref:Mitochondrial carrier protein n=1 Tax=Skeletonema marinoi TaxID=267567 RepID=A0AAD8YK10_9STRA|nr:mitochondrial carrier protein [Skeletonema marinoi]
MKKYNQSASPSRTASIIALCLLLLSVQLSYAKLSIIPQKAPSSLNLQTVPRGGGWAKAKVATVASSSPSKSTAKQQSSSAITEGLKNTLASGLAAACSKTILAPFDTLKTVQQHVSAAIAALGSMPSVGLYFGVYSYCKKTIGETLQTTFGSMRGDTEHPAVCSDRTLQTLTIIASAAIGNTVASFSRVPYEVVKQSLQTGQYSSTLQAASTMWRDGGMRSFFPLGGVSIQMVRDIPYAIFTLLSYEFIKENWVLKRTEEDPSKRWFFDMVAGATAGGIGSYLTNPMDVIKTRLQTTGGSSKYGGSIVKCAAVVLEEGGPTAFLRGSVPRLMHKIPANGCFFVFYEFFRRALHVE